MSDKDKRKYYERRGVMKHYLWRQCCRLGKLQPVVFQKEIDIYGVDGTNNDAMVMECYSLSNPVERAV